MAERPPVFFQAVAWAQRRIGGLNRCERLRLPGPPVFDALDPRPAPNRLLGEGLLETARLLPPGRRVWNDGKGVHEDGPPRTRAPPGVRVCDLHVEAAPADAGPHRRRDPGRPRVPRGEAVIRPDREHPACGGQQRAGDAPGGAPKRGFINGQHQVPGEIPPRIVLERHHAVHPATPAPDAHAPHGGDPAAAQGAASGSGRAGVTWWPVTHR